MATGGNTRDVELAIGVSTSGTDAITRLQDAVNALAKEGGTAAPAFTALSTELAKIGAQQNALDAFTTIRRDVADLSGSLDTATAAVDKLGAQLPAVREQSATFALAQKEAGDAVKATATALASVRAEYATLRDDTAQAAKSTVEYKIASSDLKDTIVVLRGQLAEQKTEFRDTATAAKQAQQAENELVGSYNQAVTAAAALSVELGRQNTALADSREAVAAVGLATTNLVEGQQQVRAAFDATQASITRQVEQLNSLRTPTDALVQAQKLLDAELEIETAGQREAVAAEQARLRSVADLTAAIQAQGRAAQTALEAAFATTGVRSAQAIDTELRNVDAALNLIARDATTSGADLERAVAASQAKVLALKNEMAGIVPVIEKTGVASQFLQNQFFQLTAAFGAFQIGEAFIDANVQLNAMERSLTIVTGSAETAAKQIDFLRKTAEESGVSVGSLQKAFGQFAASAAAAGISLETVDRTFAAVTKAAGILGLSSADAEGALLALGQSASKGKVSLEELQKQLGDRLPAVLATTAKGLGITTAELTKLVETGQLLADNTYFNAFSKGIEDTFVKGTVEVQGFNAELGRLKNVFNTTFTDVGQGGGIQLLTAAVEFLGGTLKVVTGGIAAFGTSLGTLVGIVADVARAFNSLDGSKIEAAFKRGKDAATEMADTLAKRLPESFKYLDIFGVRSDTAAEATKKLGAAADQSSGAITKSGQAAAGAAAGHDQLATATAAGATAATGAADKWIQLQVTFNKLIATAAQNSKALEDGVEAAKHSAAASTELAKLTGDENAIRQTAVETTQKQEAALRALSNSRESEANFLRIEIEALETEAKTTGTLSEARQKLLDTLRQELVVKDAAANKAKELADQYDAEALKARLLVETYGDQSAQLEKLKAAYESAAATLAKTVELQKAGAATAEDVRKATLVEVEAEARYHDALDDTVAALGRKITQLQNSANVQQSQLNLQKAQLQSEIDLANLNGNTYLALQKTIELKKLDIQIIQAKIAAQRLEAQASIALAQAEEAELAAEGKLTDAKKLEIESRIAAAKVKLLETDALSAGLAVQQKQLENLQAYGTEAGRATASNQKLTTSFGALGSSIDSSAASSGLAKIALGEYITEAEATAVAQLHLTDSFNSMATAARNAQNFSVLGKNTDSSGFSTDSTGARIGTTGQVKLPEGATFDTAAFNRDTQFAANSGQVPPDPNNPKYIKSAGGSTSPLTGNSGSTGTFNPNYSSDLAAFQARLATIPGFSSSGSSSGSTVSGSSSLNSGLVNGVTPSGQKVGGSSVSTTININGQRAGTLQLGSSQDVNVLSGVLNQLANDKARTVG